MNRRSSYRFPATILLLCLAGFGYIYAEGKVTTAQSGTEMQYGIDGGRVVARATENAKWIPVTAKLPFDVDDDAPVLVLPHRIPHKSASQAQSNAPDANILVSVPGGIYSSTDGGTRWIRSLTTSGRYKANQFRVQNGTKGTQSIFLDVEREGEAAIHSWLSRNGGMSWYKAPKNSGGSQTVAKMKLDDPRKTQALPFDITWSEPVMLSIPESDQSNPSIALSGEDTVHISWWGSEHLPYIRSTDGGETFSAVRDIYPVDTFAVIPHLRVNGSTINMIFSNMLTASIPNPDAHLIASSDGGTTWVERGIISPEHTSEPIQTTSFGDTIVMIYPQIDQFPGIDPWRMLVSTDNGIHWTKRTTHYNEDLGISLSSHSLHMLTNGYRYAHSDAIEAMYVRSIDLGATWIDTTLLSTNDGWYSDILTIASFQWNSGIEQVWASWRDTKYGWENLLGASLLGKFSLPGNRWTNEQRYTGEPNGSEEHVVANNSIRALACLLDFGDQWHVGVTWAANGITQFSPMTDLTPNLEVAAAPSIAISNNTIHVAWEQADRVHDRYHIWYRKGTIHRTAASGIATLPNEVNMDSTVVDSTRTKLLGISYNGLDTLTVGSAISDNARFTVSPSNATIVPTSGSASTGIPNPQFSVSYSSSSAGSDTGHIYIYHNGTTSPDIVSVYGKTCWKRFGATYQPGQWALVSSPLALAEPVEFSTLYGFGINGYGPSDSLLPTQGFWTKPEKDQYQYLGTPYSNIYSAHFDTICVRKGWNVIGIAQLDSVGIANLVSEPSDNTASSFFGYDGEKYFTPLSLKPGYGYFVKAKENGVLVVQHGTQNSARTAQQVPEHSSTGLLKDANHE